MNSHASLLLSIVFSVTCSSVAQLLLKSGMAAGHYAAPIAQGRWMDVMLGALTSPLVLGGLALYALGALVWLLVLARADLSFAYPFVGLGFILTLVLGRVLLDEAVSMQRLAGTLLVAAGVVLVAIEAR